jgi:RNA methyltransferase, TrmH family
MLVEGVRPVGELLESGLPVQVVLVSSEATNADEHASLRSRCVQLDVQHLSVLPEILASAADTESPQGIIAITKMPDWSDFEPGRESPLILIADQVRDPGNLGTLIRSAWGSGCDAVLIGPRSADPFSPKVVRSSAGIVLRMPVISFTWDHLPRWMSSLRAFVASADAEQNYDNVDWSGPAAIIIGNETSGVSNAAISYAHGRVGIPLANSVESLNAGVAGSVMLFEAWRQRRHSESDAQT